MKNFSTVQNNGGRAPHVSPQTSTIKHIGVALFNGFALPEMASIIEVFESANILAKTSTLPGIRYQVHLLSAAGGRVISSSSVHVCTESVGARRQADKLHALFITGGTGLHRTLHDVSLIDWLRLTSQSTRHICPTAGGNLVLEAAGLTQFVGGRMDANINGVGLEPCGTAVPEGLTSPLQRALAVVQDDLGPEIVGQIAAAPPVVETPFAAFRKDTSAALTERIRAAAQWLGDHSDQPISIGDAARVAAMSERNFLRRFRMEMGLSPSDYLLKVRLDMSCRLLAETSLPVDKIARRCGFGNGGQLTKLFRTHLAATPTSYRASKRQPYGHRCHPASSQLIASASTRPRVAAMPLVQI
ncbi:GlxA family transcriptional regulator [Paraburkholderia domus]|uniref:GlxA family transcriptional regulator n=1 Tax=Paraburkholderia domus TaxID=2793075 RepID=UPI001914AD51|nr:helix-turn-helix domain-containing protein [Paraburkholderia domus]MBK5065997.1 helix-turn-helix domain-containing protein [Burkholderia sp. R-70199]CAE6965013.1 HTH-type transcriptional activator RhaS [Paraburkholderia domus]